MVEVPIFIVNGLLDSGKTSLIKEIIENNVSYQTGNTLLVICEEGRSNTRMIGEMNLMFILLMFLLKKN